MHYEPKSATFPLRIKKMKAPLQTILFIIGLSTASYAQSITCSDFSIVSIAPDTLNPATCQVGIYLDANPNDLVGYPQVSTLIDCNGDTVATGSLFYFGQLGQTIQEYPMTLTGPLNCLTYTAVFVYGDSLGNPNTCQLTFGAAGLFQPTEHSTILQAYPNPSASAFHLHAGPELHGDHYNILDGTGKAVCSGMMISSDMTIDLSGFASGIYILETGGNIRQRVRLVKE